MDYWVSFFFSHPSSPYLKVKFMKKHRLRTIISTWRKQAPITYESLGLLQQNKYFLTPLEQANKIMSRFLLLCPSFTNIQKIYIIFSTIRKYAPNVFDALFYKFRLVQLSPVFTDPVWALISTVGKTSYQMVWLYLPKMVLCFCTNLWLKWTSSHEFWILNIL